MPATTYCKEDFFVCSFVNNTVKTLWNNELIKKIIQWNYKLAFSAIVKIIFPLFDVLHIGKFFWNEKIFTQIEAN